VWLTKKKKRLSRINDQEKRETQGDFRLAGLQRKREGGSWFSPGGGFPDVIEMKDYRVVKIVTELAK